MDDQTKGIGSERSEGRSDEYISGREALDTEGRIGERATSRIPSRTPAGRPGSADDPETTRNLSTSSTDPPTEERTREIRAAIEHTRGEMSETVNAIQERLRPGNIASSAAGSVKDTIRTVAEDKAHMVAERARDVADSEPVQYVRANPIPTAMIGIGIAGLTWLAFGGREARSYDRYRRDRYSRDWRRLTPSDESGRYYRGSAGRPGYPAQSGDPAESGFAAAGFGEVGYPGQGGYETAAAYASELEQGSRGDYAGYRSEYGKGSRSDYYGSRTAQDLGGRVQRASRDAQRTMQRAWQESPLLMGAASAVLGLVVGLAVPPSEVENEYMGEARDSALEGVQQTVRDTVNKVQDVAGNIVGVVTGESKASAPQGPEQPLNQGPGQPAGGAGQPPKKPGIA